MHTDFQQQARLPQRDRATRYVSKFVPRRVNMVELRHRAKFRRNRSNCGRGIAIFGYGHFSIF